jgi:hypothetical protein
MAMDGRLMRPCLDETVMELDRLIWPQFMARFTGLNLIQPWRVDCQICGS